MPKRSGLPAGLDDSDDSLVERTARAWKTWAKASVVKIMVCHCGRRPWMS